MQLALQSQSQERGIHEGYIVNAAMQRELHPVGVARFLKVAIPLASALLAIRRNDREGSATTATSALGDHVRTE